MPAYREPVHYRPDGKVDAARIPADPSFPLFERLRQRVARQQAEQDRRASR